MATAVDTLINQTKSIEAVPKLDDSKIVATTKDRGLYAVVILNTVVVFQPGFTEDETNALIHGFVTTAAQAAENDELANWEKHLAGGASSGWVTGKFDVNSKPIPIVTIPGEPIRKSIVKYLLQELNPRQGHDIRAIVKALELHSNEVPRQFLNEAAISKVDNGNIASASLVVALLSPTPSTLFNLHAWKFDYELRSPDLLSGSNDFTGGLQVSPLNLALDLTKYSSGELDENLSLLIKTIDIGASVSAMGGQIVHEKDDHVDLLKWAEANLTDDGHVILLSAPSGPGVYPFNASLFGIIGVSGEINILTMSIEVNAYVGLPFVGQITLGSIKGDLTTGVVMKVDVAIASGSLRFFIDNGYLKVDVVLKSTFGNWNTTVQLFHLPSF